MMRRQRVIAVDVDEVCADLLGEWLRRYSERFDDTLSVQTMTGWDLIPQVKPECGERIYEILREPDLYTHVKPIEGAWEGVELLRNAGYRVVFVTSCVAGTMDAKVRWLQRYGFLSDAHGLPDFIACTSKYLVDADVLIDDHEKNCWEFPRRSILVRHPHNRNSNWPGMQARSLFDAAQLILQRDL